MWPGQQSHRGNLAKDRANLAGYLSKCLSTSARWARVTRAVHFELRSHSLLTKCPWVPLQIAIPALQCWGKRGQVIALVQCILNPFAPLWAMIKIIHEAQGLKNTILLETKLENQSTNGRACTQKGTVFALTNVPATIFTVNTRIKPFGQRSSSNNGTLRLCFLACSLSKVKMIGKIMIQSGGQWSRQRQAGRTCPH